MVCIELLIDLRHMHLRNSEVGCLKSLEYITHLFLPPLGVGDYIPSSLDRKGPPRGRAAIAPIP